MANVVNGSGLSRDYLVGSSYGGGGDVSSIQRAVKSSEELFNSQIRGQSPSSSVASGLYSGGASARDYTDINSAIGNYPTGGMVARVNSVVGSSRSNADSLDSIIGGTSYRPSAASNVRIGDGTAPSQIAGARLDDTAAYNYASSRPSSGSSGLSSRGIGDDIAYNYASTRPSSGGSGGSSRVMGDDIAYNYVTDHSGSRVAGLAAQEAGVHNYDATSLRGAAIGATESAGTAKSSAATTTVDTSKSTTSSTTSTKTSTTTSTTGAATGGSALKVDDDKVSQFVSKLEESIISINSEWNNIIMTEVNTINNSWASEDAKEYVDKLMAEGDKISDVVLALKLLADTYRKVMNESSTTQQEVGTAVKKM